MDLNSKADRDNRGTSESPRPSKKRKLFHDSNNLDSSPLTSINSSPVRSVLKPLPTAILLLSLPNLLLVPPNHHFHTESLRLSLIALRKCLLLGSLAPEIECRAWLSFAQVGMKLVGAGLDQSRYVWAKGVEKEVEKAISKGVLLAQKHPSLRAYRHQLIIIHAQLSLWQHNAKFARGLLKRLATSFLPSDLPQIVYHTYLAIISHHTELQEFHQALSAIEDLQNLAVKNQHFHIILLCHVLHLRLLVISEMWDEVGVVLRTAEEALGLSYEPSTSYKSSQDETTFLDFDDPLECSMALHTLIIGIVYYTHIGSSADSFPRLSHLHALLDAGALEKTPQGVVPVRVDQTNLVYTKALQINFKDGSPLYIQVTHPRILFLMGFIISSITKRDAAGRKPKRKLFAIEGLATWEREMKKEIAYPLWAGLGDLEELQERQARIKADLMCELAAVSIMRSEFELAEVTLANTIAHTRTYSIFDLFSARITLHHAHLAHALGQTARALSCYKLAAYLTDDGSFVQVSAKLGQIALMIGLRAQKDKCAVRNENPGSSDGKEALDVQDQLDPGEELINELGAEITKRCPGMGSTLEATGMVIEACLSGGTLKAKQHLKNALTRATQARDNYLRALILGLTASHYFHTDCEHALRVLTTCETLAAGLGAPPNKPGSEPPSEMQKSSIPCVGNAPLRLWLGEQFLELYKRASKEEEVVKHSKKNEHLRKVVDAIHERFPPPATDVETKVT